MAKYLVVVESPAKAKTIARYLGGSYAVKASVGHVRDLPAKELGVDVEHGFIPTYHLVRGKGEILQEIQKAASDCQVVYLATDPDREGEAIAWHVAVAAHLDDAKTQRVTFHQVTKAAVEEAIAHPRALDRDLVDAQQARRVLDRLVGYQISPLLSKSMRRALSAGRVQSVALRLVVDREREILAFVPEEYWTLQAELERRSREKEHFVAALAKVAGKDPELRQQADVQRILDALAGATYTVTRVQKGERQRRPQPPFITSTLQAEAGRKLRFSPRQTMALAQQLYEGIDLDGERVGLITYMRTDSTQVAPEAQGEARRYVAERWGESYLPDRPPEYRAKVALAQEAHEAIRPTSVYRAPEGIRAHLTEQQARLYELIWQRFLASQMKPALYATITVDVTAARDYLFRATGATLLFPGYLAVYSEGRDDEEEEQREQSLPPLAEGEVVDLLRLLPEQHFTKPPPRYTEPTLIKALEANGVGRPSTYASIVTLIQERGYALKSEGRLAPTALGMVVCDILLATFSDIMDVSYTATMEERLDQVAAGELGYVAMLDGFYQGFRPELENAKGLMPQAIERALWGGLSEELRQRACPQCGKPLQVRLSEAGRFLGCTGYPQCRYILDLSSPDGQEPVAEYAEGESCEKCGGRMKVIARGRNRFLGCENYPRCKNTRPILSEKIRQLAAQAVCPQCGQTPLEPQKGRFGEYLRCPQCAVNYSLSKLGLKAGQGARRGSAPGDKGDSAQQMPPEAVDLPCPNCGHKPVEKLVGRYGPYYRCSACKTNTSEKKMAAGSRDSSAATETLAMDET